MKSKTKLFELAETMRKASMAAYDVNRSIQRLAKMDPAKAREIEQEAISGLLCTVMRASEFQSLSKAVEAAEAALVGVGHCLHVTKSGRVRSYPIAYDERSFGVAPV